MQLCCTPKDSLETITLLHKKIVRLFYAIDMIIILIIYNKYIIPLDITSGMSPWNF